MQKFTSLIFLILEIGIAQAQIVKIVPDNASANDEIEVIFDATKGTAGLVGAASVYMHSGVLTDKPNGTAWQHVKGNWGKDDGVGKMTKVEGAADLWSIKLSPTARQYYGVADGIPVFRLSMVFRNADGSKEGKGTVGNFPGGAVASNGDIYLDLDVRNYVQILEPMNSPIFIDSNAKQIFKASASGKASLLNLYVDEGSGIQLLKSSENQQTIEAEFKPTKTGLVSLTAEAIFGVDTQRVSKNIQYVFRRTITTAAIPAGLKKGINYSDDKSKVNLVLEAPQKEFVYVVGDFNNWEIRDEFLMNKTSDGEFFWLEINDLEPGKEYVFQYWVDGTIRIPDSYADKIADPWNDKDIPIAVYPDLPSYERQDFGIASVFQTNQATFNWGNSEQNWTRPPKENLLIYELLVRDFIGSHNYRDLADTLSYLKKLGGNAIELMPIMEFEGNESWGYNVSQFFAPDKYYGTKNDLKNFIQIAHKEGFAVILDMVLNHAFGQNPLVKMYWDQTQNKPAANNPWFNADATHPFNVGYDFNHESSYTQAFVDSVNTYWLKEYHFDGFRFDLSKGFTQKRNTDVGLWSARDDSRIAILKRMAGKIREVDSEAYIILEHFADISEENELRADGMMTWGNNNHDFGDLMLGKTSQMLSSINNPLRVSYMESHDEQRQIYLAEKGSVLLNSTYDPRIEIIALNRLKLMSAFFYSLPGPKHMWQFQELGYNIDINFNGRVGNKPLVWGEGNLKYYENAERQKLFKTHAALINLRNANSEVFQSGKLTKSMSGSVKSLSFEHSKLNVAIVGNFDLKNANTTFTFSKNGRWFDYFQKDSIEVTGAMNFSLSPGEFHVFTSIKQPEIDDSLITFFEARDTLIVHGEIVTVSPKEFQAETEMVITFDASEADGNGTFGLIGANKVYMHSGIITSSETGTDWQYVVGNWGKDDGIGKMSRVNGTSDTWQIRITPKNYFSGVPNNAEWKRIGMVFRNEDGSREGKGLGGTDIFVNFTSKKEEAALGIESEIPILVYPNPTSDFFEILGLDDFKEILIYNTTGKLVKKFTPKSKLTIKNIPAGLYHVKIRSTDKTYVKRLLIN